MALAHCSRGKEGGVGPAWKDAMRKGYEGGPFQIVLAAPLLIHLFFSHFLTITSSFVWFASYPCYLSSIFSHL